MPQKHGFMPDGIHNLRPSLQTAMLVTTNIAVDWTTDWIMDVLDNGLGQEVLG
ncbi:hypothetical protein [Leptolyngbya sp. BL0902]|uniref:hypothetical protein n=1 Tax=Leptolyngbya sp. BL0902 TaxID=1115757 RepID=UPI0018E8CF83|nr:hypothetical protein [Leptolyngbya sp. BL0902]